MEGAHFSNPKISVITWPDETVNQGRGRSDSKNKKKKKIVYVIKILKYILINITSKVPDIVNWSVTENSL